MWSICRTCRKRSLARRRRSIFCLTPPGDCASPDAIRRRGSRIRNGPSPSSPIPSRPSLRGAGRNAAGDAQMTNAYDLVRYPNWPVSETHPAMLGAFAVLFGRRAAPVSACRVLEIGCGEGVNLMSMAVGLPKSEFVGLDLAEAPIGLGRTMARVASLDNVSLFARDVKDGSAALGQFDYVIAHGIYAWVPAAVREALMRLAAQRLSPDGLFLVSYNVRPGCRLRQALRDLMREAAQGLENPAEKTEAARNALARFIEIWSPKDAFQNALIEEARDALKRPPSLIYHDELGDVYEPQFLADVVASAR